MATLDESPDEDIRPRSELQTFFIKLVSVLMAVVLLFLVSVSFLKSELEDSALIKGGPEFWNGVEQSLHRIANAKDIPEERKARIIESLHKLSAKYGPFIDALNSGSKKP